MTESILLFCILFNPATQLDMAVSASINREYEHSILLLKNIKLKNIPFERQGEYWFHKSVAEYVMLDKTSCEASLKNLLHSFNFNPTTRHKVLGEMMQEELKNWKGSGLDRVGRLTYNVERRLALGKLDKETFRQQKEIIYRLDELIKQEEENEKQAGQGDGNGSKPGCPIPSKGDKDGKAERGGQSKPAKDSKIMEGGGLGEVERKHFEKLAKQWGKLPEKERAAAIEQLRSSLPPKYREAVQNYFKKMAQGKQ